MLFSLLKHYLSLYITDTALKVFKYLYCFTTSISLGVETPGCGVQASLMPFLSYIFQDILPLCYFPPQARYNQYRGYIEQDIFFANSGTPLLWIISVNKCQFFY